MTYNDYLRLLGFNAEQARRASIKDNSSFEVDGLVASLRRRLEDSLGDAAQSTRRIKEVFADIDDDRRCDASLPSTP
jgi:hypothetical protein